MSDLFYVSYGRSLGDRVSLTDSQGHRTRGKTHHYNLHYSVFSFGYWRLFYDQSYYRYHQAIAGAYENYDYNGRSLRRAFGLNRVLSRDRHRKTQAKSFNFWSASLIIISVMQSLKRYNASAWVAGKRV